MIDHADKKLYAKQSFLQVCILFNSLLANSEITEYKLISKVFKNIYIDSGERPYILFSAMCTNVFIKLYNELVGCVASAHIIHHK